MWKANRFRMNWQGCEWNLKPCFLKQIQLSQGPAKAQVNFLNGDQMEAALLSAAFPVETLFGTFDIPAELVRRADFSVLGRQGAVGEEGLLLDDSFESRPDGFALALGWRSKHCGSRNRLS